MPILIFLWYSIRPIGKLESAVGTLDIANILFHILWGGGAYLMTNWDWFRPEYLWGVPAVLFLIAGLKLQFRFDKIENSYAYSLSLDDLDIERRLNKLYISLKLSNTLDRPLEFQMDQTAISIEVDGKKPNTSQQDKIIHTVLPPKKSTKIHCPGLPIPTRNPSLGKLYYELVYGLPNKPLFRQIRELELEVTQEVVLNKAIKYSLQSFIRHQEDSPIKKRGLDKADSQTEQA